MTKKDGQYERKTTFKKWKPSLKKNLIYVNDNEQAKNELRPMGGGHNNQNMSILDKLNLPYPIETVENYNGEYSQEEIDIAEAIFAWWISGKGYEQWYAENISQQKIDFGQ